MRKNVAIRSDNVVYIIKLEQKNSQLFNYVQGLNYNDKTYAIFKRRTGGNYV